MPSATECDLPPAAPDERVYVAGTTEGGAVSTVALGSMDKVTTTAEVKVETNGGPIYAILYASNRTIWRFTGDTARISRVVVASGKYGAGGVTGIPREKVSFLSGSKCVVGHEHVDPAHHVGQRAEQVIESLLGLRPEVVSSMWLDDSVSSVILPSFQPGRFSGWGLTMRGGRGPVVVPLLPESRYPPGYDQYAYREALRTHWDGVAEVDLSQLVSSEPAAYYDVQPGHVGIAKLVFEGALLRISTNGSGVYRVQRSLPRFPAMPPEQHVKLVLPKGMPMPSRTSDQSLCVVEEETGRILVGSDGMCRYADRVRSEE